jgi:DNA primase
MSGPKEYLEIASREYHSQLMNLPEAHGVIDYLRNHGIGTRKIAERYKLGYVGTPLRNDDRFAGGLVIPYLTRAGVRAIKVRMFDGDIKFNQPHGQQPRLYNPAAYFSARDQIGICEGEIDAITATECLQIPSLGIPGAEIWRGKVSIWLPLFKDFRSVLIFADGDDAGKRMAYTVSESIGWRARIIQCPDGEDVSSMVMSDGGKQDLLEACKNCE